LWDEAHPKGASEDEEFDDVDGEMPPKDMPPEDTDSMSPDDLASHITGEPRSGDEEGPDLESRVDDLEDRIADLEHDEAGEHHEDDDVEGDIPADARDGDMPAIVDDETDAEDEMPPEEPARTRSRANVVEKGFDEEEQVKSMFRQAITSPKEHLTAALKDVEAEGAKAWAKMQLATNPHPKKSPAFHAWAKGFKNSGKAGLGIVDKPASTSKPKKR
jgi:hypothetical protein